MEGVRSGRASTAVGGSVLIVLGGVWFAIGAVLLVLAWLYGRGPEAVPPTVNVDPGLVGAAPRALGLGLLGLALGLGQGVVGWSAARGTTEWAPRVGGVLALGGAALVAAWLVSGVAAGQPVLVLLAPLAAYAAAGYALFRGGEAERIEGDDEPGRR